MIELEHVTKAYGNFRAVNDLSLIVRPGEIFGFLGVNGAGKTTTLSMLAGVLRPTSGTIRIGGFNLAVEPDRAKHITGYIPDRPYLYSKLTAREFLYFVGELYQVPLAKVDQKIGELLEAYGLADWQDELIESFSHGMKQRLATCAALVHEPQVLIVDEPIVGLDPHGAKLFKESIRRYASQGMAILLSTHSLHVAEEVSDRIAIINQGSLLITGTVDEVKARAGSNQANLEKVFLELTSANGHHTSYDTRIA